MSWNRGHITRNILLAVMPFAIILIALTVVMQFVDGQTEKNDIPSFQSIAKVTRVIDGDTFEAIAVGENADITVRLIGVDAPESVNPDTSLNSLEGEQASSHLKETLPAGTIVYLERDVSETDKYGRYLYYVWLDSSVADNDIENEITEIDFSSMLNYQLVADGYAVAKQYPPDTKYAKVLSEAAKEKK